MLRPEILRIKKFLSENREFKLARIVNKKLEVKLTGKSDTTYNVSDFSLGCLMRRKLEELEMSLGLERS